MLLLALAGALMLPAAALATGSQHGSGGGSEGAPHAGSQGGGWPWGAACEIEKVTSITPTLANLGSYRPPDLPAPLAIDITVGLKTSGQGTCHGALTFYRPTLPARLSVQGGGSATRPYAIQSAPGGGTPLLFASWPPAGHTLDFTVQGGWGTRSVTLTVYVAAAGGWLTAGSYADTVLVKVLDRKDNGYRIVRHQEFAVTSLVQQACDLPAPSVSSLDFSSAISQGLPDTTTLSVTFTGVACSAPARIRLFGAPLINPGIAPVANFDNFIDWQAEATFGLAHALLDTRQTNQVTSAAQNVASGPTQSGLITVQVKLLPGRRIIAGHYSNVLTVSIDPAY